jgi:tRNA1(Val) A37 N6-methylase TrmN6
VLELGSGYGLAGFAIAACTDASEVIISDGNPQVVNCILCITLEMFFDRIFFKKN